MAKTQKFDIYKFLHKNNELLLVVGLCLLINFLTQTSIGIIVAGIFSIVKAKRRKPIANSKMKNINLLCVSFALIASSITYLILSFFGFELGPISFDLPLTTDGLQFGNIFIFFIIFTFTIAASTAIYAFLYLYIYYQVKNNNKFNFATRIVITYFLMLILAIEDVFQFYNGIDFFIPVIISFLMSLTVFIGEAVIYAWLADKTESMIPLFLAIFCSSFFGGILSNMFIGINFESVLTINYFFFYIVIACYCLFISKNNPKLLKLGKS